MTLTLTRKQAREDGIFGELRHESGTLIAVTLEHAYWVLGWNPKIPCGTFTCKRGLHRLEGMTEAFETFEITGVPGHTNLLFHVGNFQRDSHGCVLLGAQIGRWEDGSQMITKSRPTFAHFMAMLEGVDEFQLVVGS